MNYNLFRKWHRWFSLVIAIPFSITLVTGIILSTRAFNVWVQPQSVLLDKINDQKLTITLEEILEQAKTIPAAQIQEWKDVSQIDIRPDRGNIRIRSRQTDWEIQIDGLQKKVISDGPRKFSTLVAIHEGAYFGSFIRYGIFFTSALGVFLLTASGMVILYYHYSKKKRA